jgi:anti-sigma factor RsiW
MRNDEHLSEETLDSYLDGELDANEHSRIEAHLETCAACCAELEALQELFAALKELEISPVPAPDLVPSVLARIRPPCRDLKLRWLVPTLQGIAALALLTWGWTWLTGYWKEAVHALPTETVVEVCSQAAEWVIAHWTRLNALPIAVWNSTQSWLTHPSSFSNPSFSVPQSVAAGIVLGTLWLACNVMLLRRPLLNGHKTQS